MDWNWLPKIFQPRVRHISGQAQYHPAVFYPVGAENMVYEPPYPQVARMTPVVWYSANGIPAGSAPSPLTLPQLYSNQTSYISGIGGPIAGQMVLGPLNIPETTNGSQ